MSREETVRFQPPSVTYEPQDPDSYDPGIALIGCGSITEKHLTAYSDAGYRVLAFCDIDESVATARRDEFYPDADVYTDAANVFAREDVDVVDIATHPEPRVGIMEDAIDAGKHVLSQKPFVLDLDTGESLIENAEQAGVKLAVNQNGRWAPHWSYMREATAAGLVGDPYYIDCSVHWPHDSWILGTAFERLDHAVLYDFAIHWFDFVASIFEDSMPTKVSASAIQSPVQESRPPLLSQARIDYEDAQASLTFNGGGRHGGHADTRVSGSEGALVCEGPNIQEQDVTLHIGEGTWNPTVEGTWYPTGMHGTMGELLSAVEDDREPLNSARENLRSLQLCFAAVASAERGEPVDPTTVRELPTDA